jgi:putative phosphoribosyl transferase
VLVHRGSSPAGRSPAAGSRIPPQHLHQITAGRGWAGPEGLSSAVALTCESRLTVIPGATHLFEEPGALEQVADLAIDWFTGHLPAQAAPATPGVTPSDPANAGKLSGSARS